MKNRLILLFLLLLHDSVNAQNRIENLIIITTDGLRWQEIFNGVDTVIANNERFNEKDSSYIYRNYGASNPFESRKKIFPFLWSTFLKEGQLYGNRAYHTNVNTANPYRTSYPGYSELLTGYTDLTINSNSFPNNPNANFLGFLHKQPQFKNQVAVFCAWETFNRILNEPNIGFPVIAAFDKTGGAHPTEKEILFNSMLTSSYKPWNYGECLDVFTHHAALEHLKTKQPRVLYIAYGETDEWAHSGKYKSYLNAAKQVDEWIEEIWTYVQSQPKYKNKTALILTTDHGRGETWRWTEHDSSVPASDQTWFGIMAPGIKAKGEVKTTIQLYQQQLAQTMAALLGLKFKAEHPVAEAVEEINK
ncbi:MAG: alkaline phosphatase family protein [Pyrinomonadaceae bacterium]|nr:alkaline phosphatase family protein [Sphingobacteriaceae bacterium]